jgi:hypothetical protein
VTRLRTEQTGNRMSLSARKFVVSNTVQTGCATHTASYLMNTGVNCAGRDLQPVARVRISGAIPLISDMPSQGNLYLYILQF